MTTTSRQNNLILAEDWTRIYQTFKNADFKSYDFENLRRVMLTYLRENYAEDFNDYIESSEYLALIDVIAFLGQSLAFRIDLASRENFIELAERKESVLRLARTLAYNPKRNIAAKALLKFDTVRTTETILDSNGKDLAKQVISWNDPTNSNWAEQFLLVLNSAMTPNTEFGRSEGTATIGGITTDQYRFNTSSSDIALFQFSKVVAARNMSFELVSTVFKDKEEIYEESPIPGTQLGFVYKNDGKGAGSPTTGFFLLCKQGSLELADFTISQPTTNEKVAVDAANINNDDVWLYSLNSNGSQGEEWTQVSNLTGNNIAYNSLSKNIRNIYSVISKADDKVEVQFSDGIYGNLPQGTFRLYYRVSNGLEYVINPSELRGITIEIPYLNKANVAHTLTISLSLKSISNNATAAEDIESVRIKAPAQYYTQNRMVTGEDYNLAPLTASQQIVKVKAINRTSSGISRNFDIIDATGKYSKVNVFADDGIIYKQETERTLQSKFNNRSEIINFIKNQIEPLFTEVDVYNFYLTNYDKILYTDDNTHWLQSTEDINQSTGYFRNANDLNLIKTGNFATNNMKYLEAGALMKFVPPAGKAFKNGQIVTVDSTDSEQVDRIWTKVIRVVGDGTNAGRGNLANGTGPVVFNDIVPTDAIARRIVPKFVNNLPESLEAEIVNLVVAKVNFGLRYSIAERQWKIITASNINLTDQFFGTANAGDSTGTNRDSSWILAWIFDGIQYVIRVRALDYVFSSVNQNRFYFDNTEKVYDPRTQQIVKDQVKVLRLNTNSSLINPLQRDYAFEINDNVRYDDGYQSTDSVKVGFYDSDDDGVIDNPESFEIIVGTDQDRKYVFFEEVEDSYGAKTFQYVENTNNTKFLVREKSITENVNNYSDGQLIYFYDLSEDLVRKVNKTTNTFDIQSQYRANIGRPGLKFQYIHNAMVDRRIDPSVSNIIDVFLLTRSYDTEYRKYLRGAIIEPSVPTTESLRIEFGSNLNAIKSISDEIVYHPVKYKALFGAKADSQFRATFKVVKNKEKTISDNDLKVRIIAAINEFFDVDNWDFGDKFYFTELSTYVINSVSPDISNFAIVPKQADQSFGSLYEIQAKQDEILISAATVDDVEIVESISASQINVSSTTVVTSTS